MANMVRWDLLENITVVIHIEIQYVNIYIRKLIHANNFYHTRLKTMVYKNHIILL